jgi:uncharacterized repeat protein (TIGR03806 family)
VDGADALAGAPVTQTFAFVATLALAAVSCSGTGCRPPPEVSDALAEVDGLALEPAFGQLRFERPVFLGTAPGDSRLFVVEQHGAVWAVDQQSGERSLFFDISDRVTRIGNEEGLIGLAFHPNYAENGRIFVHYSATKSGPRGVVAELRRLPDGSVDTNERLILEQPQPYRNHNGGMLAFGPDGYLYIGFGDGGSAGDPASHGQNLGTWLGSILRIDVDTRSNEKAYAIPPDNPFVAIEGARPEIWALGLRNPWRFSFDRATGRLWVGDIGQNAFEEIDIVERGGNYGWKTFEGPAPYAPEVELAHGSHAQPVAHYGRDEGQSVTGGYVYRGEGMPGLQGVYVFGDFETGLVWGLFPDGPRWERRLLLDSRLQIASFGEDQRGELYLCTFDGRIHKLVPGSSPQSFAAGFPKTLSETGLFASLRDHAFAETIFAYEVNAPLWSDGADKLRGLRVPEGERIRIREDGDFDVPDGTIAIKTFSLAGQRIETRLVRRDGDEWRAASYVWRADGSDADLVPEGADIELGGEGKWHVPSALDCRACHTLAAGFTLGLEVAQLNRGDQLQRLRSKGWIGTVPSLPGLADPGSDAPLDARARAYLHANCSPCHRPGGPGNASIDLRHVVPLAETGLVGVTPAQGDMGRTNAVLLAPGEPERSLLLERMTKRGPGAMPPLASARADDAAVDLIREWVRGLDV